LSLGNIVVNAGPPTWQFIIVLLASVGYICVSYLLIKFNIKNFRDLGFEVYASWSRHLVDRLSHGIENIRGGVSSIVTGGAIGGTARNSVADDVTGGPLSESTNVDNSTNVSNKYYENNTDNSVNIDINSESSGYQMDETDTTGNGNSEHNYYDDESEKGSKMDNEEDDIPIDSDDSDEEDDED
jgi:hypothetical protein